MTHESKQSFFATNGKSCVSVYVDEQQGAVIAIYGDQRRDKHPVVAISVGRDSVARLQVKTESGVVILDLAKTVQALASLGTLTQQPLLAMPQQSFDRQEDLPTSSPSVSTPSLLQQTQPQPAGAA